VTVAPPVEDPILTTREVCDMVRRGPQALRVAWKAGRFPRPIKLSPRRNGWRRSVVLAHLASLEAASAAEVARAQ
jgi:predicted DNA-binding transcriptional regulator AlpA